MDSLFIGIVCLLIAAVWFAFGWQCGMKYEREKNLKALEKILKVNDSD